MGNSQTATATEEMNAQEYGVKTKEDPEQGFDVNIENIEFEVESEGVPEPEYEETEPEYVEPEPEYQEPYYYDDYNDRFRRPTRAINKHVFTWLFSFFLGMYGVDRFARGQIGLGLAKMLTFGGFGFWFLADFFTALYKSYQGDFSDGEELLFDTYGRYAD